MSQLMPGEFLQQFLRVIGKDRHDVLTPPGWPQWRTTYHFTTSAGVEDVTELALASGAEH